MTSPKLEGKKEKKDTFQIENEFIYVSSVILEKSLNVMFSLLYLLQQQHNFFFSKYQTINIK